MENSIKKLAGKVKNPPVKVIKILSNSLNWFVFNKEDFKFFCTHPSWWGIGCLFWAGLYLILTSIVFTIPIIESVGMIWGEHVQNILITLDKQYPRIYVSIPSVEDIAIFSGVSLIALVISIILVVTSFIYRQDRSEKGGE